jgi:hypothetical protein
MVGSDASPNYPSALTYKHLGSMDGMYLAAFWGRGIQSGDTFSSLCSDLATQISSFSTPLLPYPAWCAGGPSSLNTPTLMYLHFHTLQTAGVNTCEDWTFPAPVASIYYYAPHPTCSCPLRPVGAYLAYDPDAGFPPPYQCYNTLAADEILCDQNNCLSDVDTFCSFSPGHGYGLAQANCVECVDGTYPVDCSRFAGKNWSSYIVNPALSGCVTYNCVANSCSNVEPLFLNVCSDCDNAPCMSLNPATSACDIPKADGVGQGKHGQTCCGGHVVLPNEACCNGTYYNTTTHFCCNNTIYLSGANSCCNNNVYNTTTQACCNNTAIYAISAQGCCADGTYYTATQGCCNGTQTFNTGYEACCADGKYNTGTHICCNGTTYDSLFYGCCDNLYPYDLLLYECCFSLTVCASGKCCGNFGSPVCCGPSQTCNLGVCV